MRLIDIPVKFGIKWARDAVAAYLRTVPNTTSDPTAASFALGWPPATATPVTAGGTPPDARDENGILQAVSAWIQWMNAGAPVQYDAAFAALIGGYPVGAFLENKSTLGSYWISTVDNNSTDPDAGGANWQPFPSQAVTSGARNGQCRFQYGGATTLCALVPIDGNGIVINQTVRLIGSGVSITNSGLAPSTFYYCYAYWTGSAVALEFSTTPRATGTDGTQIKNGDPTRALVGAVYTDGSSLFVQDDHTIGVISWFSKIPRYAWNSPAPNVGIGASGVAVELSTSARTHFINWASSGIVASSWNVFQTNVPASRTSVFMGIDGIGGPNVIAGTQFEQLVPPGANQNTFAGNGIPYIEAIAENVQHYLTIGVTIFENQTTWIGNGGYGTSVQVTG